MQKAVSLRDVIEDDYPIFFLLQRDPTSAQMAAFGTKDPDAAALAARWKKATGGAATQKAIVLGSEVVGFVASFLLDGAPQVTYWIKREHWGRGIATAALSQLLEIVTVRPIYAGAVKDNAGSLRVLEKCGFKVCGSERAFAAVRGAEVDEVLLVLE